jgi:hypothetical protein
MNSDSLKYQLIRGLSIIFQDNNNQRIKVKQPKIEDIDDIGLLPYLSMTYIFRIQKEHLQIYDEIKDKINNKSLFESMIIQEEILNSKSDFNISESIIMLLIQSLAFFLDIKDFNRIGVSDNIDAIIVYDFKDVNGEICKIPIFQLDNNNFGEFSELIRIITCNSIIEIDKDNNVKKLYYADPEVQRMYEEQIKLYLEEEKKEEKENQLTISDVIGSICINENTKYNYKNIQDLTIWQLFYQFNSMFAKENIEIVKSQYTSGNYNFEKVPDLDWLRKVKVKLPNDMENNKMND